MTDVKQQFVDDYYVYAERAAALIGNSKVSAMHILSMWAQETGWGKQINGTNNLGGIKPGGRIANYDTMQDFISSYVTVLNKDVANQSGNNFFEKLANGIYEGYDKQPNVEYSKAVQSVFDNMPPMPNVSDGWLSDIWTGAKDWLKSNYPPGDVVIGTPENPNPDGHVENPGGGNSSMWDGFFSGLSGFGNKIGLFILGVVGVGVGFYLLSKGEDKSE